MEGIITGLPKITEEDLGIWDAQKQMCCGYLNKKAGLSSTFSKGKWQKRWFVLKSKISAHENYTLLYFHSPDDRLPRQVYSLDGARVDCNQFNNSSNSFELFCPDGSHLVMSGENPSQMHTWVQTLKDVVQIATERGQIQRDRRSGRPVDLATDKIMPKTATENDNNPMSTVDQVSHINPQKPFKEISPQRNMMNPFQIRQQKPPMIRLDVDIATIPPGSVERHQFEELLVNDIKRALQIGSETVEIVSVLPAPGANWLTTVEFDIMINDFSDFDCDVNEGRASLFIDFLNMLVDPASMLYSGFVTCKLDPTFSKNFPTDSSSAVDEIFSTDNKILGIMQRYNDVVMPANILDVSHFTIYLAFEGVSKPLRVPNPLILRKKCCNIWPFEVKQVLGFAGTMQELWIEPVSLIPRGMPREVSHAIFFEPSARLGGNIAINASRLKADLTYDVQCQDFRGEVIKTLTEQERISIKATFDHYDKDGSGSISRAELESLVKTRTTERRKQIEDKYTEYMSVEVNGNSETAAKAAEQKMLLLQQLTESQNKLIKMFIMADADGDGSLSFTEFLLAEAWWLRCTLNPDHAHLF